MYYYSFSQYLKRKYGEKVRRLGLNAGFSCPNMERGGCVFCNELGFSRFAGKDIPLKEQIESSIAGAREKFNAHKFIAYFQNATGTNAEPARLKEAYDVIRGYPDIVGLYISTRPDCVDAAKLDLIASYRNDYEVWIEYGLQTVHDKSLQLMNRGHTFSRSVDAVKWAAERGIKVGAHVILGLPGESAEDMIMTARGISSLPVSGVKLHVLHVLKDTDMVQMYRRGEIELLSRERYVSAACDFLENLRPDCVIFRLLSDAREDLLVAPGWMNDKLAVIKDIEEELAARGTEQGSAREKG